MRKYLNLAMESNHGSEISMEEAENLREEAAADAAEVEETLNEADDNGQVVDALEDLAVIADGIDTPTDTEMALISNTESALTIGTDLEEGSLIPEVALVATESYRGMKISTESIRENARTIWNNIQKFLKKIWEKIESFFYKLFGTIPSLRKNIKSLQARIDSSNGQTKSESKFTVSSGVASLSVDYVPCKNEAELKTGFKTFEEMAKLAYITVTDDAIKAGDAIAKAISDFDPAKANDCLHGLNEDMLKHNGTGKTAIGGTTDKTRFSGYTAYMSKPMLGNVSFITKKSDKEIDGSEISKAEWLRNAGTSLGKTSATTKEGPTEFVMQTLSHAGMLDLLGESEKLLDILEEFKRGKRTKDLTKTRDSVHSACDKAAAKMDKFDKSEGDEKLAAPYYRAMIDYSKAYTRWVQQPAMPMYSHSLTVIRAIMVVCQKSLACYK